MPTKVYLVKAMFFPVVTYGCEIWTMKKAEHQRIDAFELWCWESFESPLNCNIKLVNPKGKQSWIFIGRTDTEPVVLILWLPDGRADSFEKTLMLGKIEDRRRGWQDEMVGWLHWLSGHEFEQALGDGEGQGSLVCCSPLGCKESDVTEWTTTTNGCEQQQQTVRNNRCKGITMSLIASMSQTDLYPQPLGFLTSKWEC